jgi:hypothetical protein
VADTQPVCLATARRVREQRKGLALAITSEPGGVRVIVDGTELAVDPDLGEVIGLEILAACKAAREARRGG